MTLEERYNAATNGNAAKASAIGTSKTPTTNFFDGVGRDQGNNIPDEYQSEFTANEPGDYRYGKNKVPGSDQPLSTWKDKGLAKAFGDVDGRKSDNSFYTNTRFNPTYSDNGKSVSIHKFAPLKDRDFVSSLADLAKGRVLGRAAGPIG